MTTTRNASASDSWGTPDEVIELVKRVDRIGCDPCSDGIRLLGDVNFTGKETDGLHSCWDAVDGLTFVNPPFSNKRKWAEKAVTEAGKGVEIIMLVPAGPSAAWFQPLLTAQAMCFWKGRMRFVERSYYQIRGEFFYKARAGAMFDVCLVYFGTRPGSFVAAFEGAGLCVQLNARRAA